MKYLTMKSVSFAILILCICCGFAEASGMTITSNINPLSSIDSWEKMVAACGTMAPYTTRQNYRYYASATIFSSMVSNSFIWVMYGSLKDLKSVFLANSVGFILGTYYMFMFSRYCGAMADNLPGTIEQHWKGTGAIVFLNVFLAATLPKNRAKDVVGKAGMLSFIVLFASPLAALKQVIESKSAASIPLPFTIASIVNCFLWAVAGIWEMQDIYIWLPSILGFCCAIVQLVLKVMYGDRVHIRRTNSILK